MVKMENKSNNIDNELANLEVKSISFLDDKNILDFNLDEKLNIYQYDKVKTKSDCDFSFKKIKSELLLGDEKLLDFESDENERIFHDKVKTENDKINIESTC